MLLSVVTEHLAAGGAALAFASDGVHWAAASTGTVHLWNGPDLLHSVSVPSYIGGPPCFGRGGDLLHVGLYTIEVSSSAVTALSTAFMPDDHAAAFVAHVPERNRALVLASFLPTRSIGTVDSYSGPRTRLLLVDTDTGRLVSTLRDDADEVDEACLAVGGYFASLVTGDRLARWSIDAGELMSAAGVEPTSGESPISVLERAASRCDAAAVDTSGLRTAALRRDGSVTLFGPDGEPTHTWSAHTGAGAAVAFSPAGDHLATATREGLLQIWALDGTSPNLEARIELHSVADLCFDPFGLRLLVASGSPHRQVTELALS